MNRRVRKRAHVGPPLERAEEAERAVERIKAQAEEWVSETHRGFLEARSKLDAEVESARAQRAELEERLARSERAAAEAASALEAERKARTKLESRLATARGGQAERVARKTAGDTDRASVWARVKALAAEGHSQREIARRLQINRRTVARLVAADEPPRYHREAQGSMLDPLEPVMRSALREEPAIDAPHMTEILREHGYRGSVDLVRRRLRRLRAAGPT
jgi:hypothetical protein